MTLVPLSGAVLYWPGLARQQTGNLTLATDFTLDSTGDYQAYIGVAPYTMVITDVGFRTGTVANSPTAIISIQDVTDSTGFPSGTPLNGGTATVTTGVLSSNTWNTATLGGTATVNAGETFAFVVTWGGVATSTLIVQRVNNLLTTTIDNVPYEVTNTSGAAAKIRLTSSKAFAVATSGPTWINIPGMMPVTAAASATFASNARRGMRFRVPFNTRCIGVRLNVSNTAGDFTVAIYSDVAGTELSSSSTAYQGDESAANTGGILNLFFDNPVTLTAGTWYRAAIEATSATNCTFSTFTLPSSVYAACVPGDNTNHHYTLYPAGGPWDDSNTTQVGVVDIIIDQVDDGTGSGLAGASAVNVVQANVGVLTNTIGY